MKFIKKMFIENDVWKAFVIGYLIGAIVMFIAVYIFYEI